MGHIAKLTRTLVGEPMELPPSLVDQWPELRKVRCRRGGLPPLIGGWMLARPAVAAITLGRTIFFSSTTRLDPELVLHELRHVQQFAERRTFPFRYIWESLRKGYHANRYEADARDWAARRIARAAAPDTREDA